MRRFGWQDLATASWLAAIVLAATTAPARASDPFLLSVSVLGGAGGPLDADEPDPGAGQRSMELQIGLVTEPRTLVELRVGRIDFGSADRLGDVLSPQLEYATVGGEYRMYHDWYDSGVFAGLGGYRLSGDSAIGASGSEETVIGLNAGFTAEFELTQHVGVLTQLTGHYVNLDQVQLFATAMGGLSVKF